MGDAPIHYMLAVLLTPEQISEVSAKIHDYCQSKPAG